jgi:NAD(P)-dependent dehydrogenase (short-subunit alcohol dehydrogenase family)
MRDVTDRVAVVTGGGSGIGAGILLALAGAGAKVAVADVDLAAASAVAEQARSRGAEAIAVRTDVSSFQDVSRLAAAVLDRWGEVGVLCNNAGVSLKRRGLYATHADWQWILGVNLWGVVHGMEAFLPAMVASGREGHVVNTSSMNGLLPSARSPMYSAAKYGVVGLSETYRNELAGTAVSIAVLCPAAVDTRIDDSERNRPDGPATDAPEFAPSTSYDLSPALSADEVGALVLDGIRQNRFYLFTDRAIRPYLEARHREIMTDLGIVSGPDHPGR